MPRIRTRQVGWSVGKTKPMATGLRRGEVRRLKWEYADFIDQQIHVYKKITRNCGRGLVESEPKTERSKCTITMTPFLEELLRKVQGTQIGQKDYLENTWVNDGYVFSQPDDKAIDPDLITKAFNKSAQEDGEGSWSASSHTTTVTSTHHLCLPVGGVVFATSCTNPRATI